MKLTARAESLVDRLALALNLAPVPVVEMVFGMGLSRSLVTAARLGMLARLARSPATIDDLVADCDVSRVPARLLLDTLVVVGHLRAHDGTYDLSRKSRKWLDPASPTSVTAFLESGADAWSWWTELETVVRTGRTFAIHDADADDPYWRRYLLGQYQLARLSAPHVARALKVDRDASSVLDVGGGHGWFSAELCRRRSGLRSTVVDLPGSAAVGREIIAAAGLSDRVVHVDGDAREAPLGGPHDLALCFNLIHYLEPADVVALFARIHDALRPDATFAVLDIVATANADTTGAGLFYYLMSGAEACTAGDIREWLDVAGFTAPRKLTVRALPFQSLFTARRKP